MKKIYIKSILLGITILFLSQHTFAQKQHASAEQKKDPSLRMHRTSGVSTKAGLDNYKQIPYEAIYNKHEWEDPSENFLGGAADPAGDINNDGYDDMVYRAGTCGDETTPNIMDVTYKTKVIFGNASGDFDSHVVNYQVNPMGDLNGDGYCDAIGITYQGDTIYLRGSDSGYEKEPTENIKIASHYRGFLDIDEDGYGDLVSIKNTEQIVITFGASNTSEFTTKTFHIPDFSLIRVYVDSINQTGNKLLLEGYLNGYYDQHSMIFGSLNENRELVHEDTLKPASRWYFEGVEDLNSDGFKEFLFRDQEYNSTTYLSILAYPQAGNNNLYGDSPVEIYEESDLTYVGDVNGDGSSDFITGSEGDHYLSWCANGLNEGITRQQIINMSGLSSYLLNQEPLGDVNGDGYDDFNYQITTPTQKGERIFFGDASSGLTQKDFLKDKLGKEEFVKQTVNLGDINGDNQEDVAYLGEKLIRVYTDAIDDTPELEIHADQPDQDYPQFEILVGDDFNGDGYNDLAVYKQGEPTENGENESSTVEFYYGGAEPDNNKDHSISFKYDLEVTSWDGLGVKKIGDINDDGVHDFLLYGEGDLFLYYGGSNLSSSPDIVVDANESNLGARVHMLGDINEDGIDDFVAGAGKGVKVFFGKGSGATAQDYQEPDLVLAGTEALGSYATSDFGHTTATGDFNGDGINDVVGLPYYMKDEQGNGLEGLNIFYGGASMDTIPDVTLKIPAGPLGGPEQEYLPMYLGEVSSLPDMNGDQTEELFMAGSWWVDQPEGYYLTNNGIIIQGGDYLTQDSVPAYQLPSTQKEYAFGPKNSYYFTDRQSARGDFDADGDYELVIVMQNPTFRGTTIYEYPIGNSTPEDVSLSENTIEENQAVETSVGSIVCEDLDERDTHTFALVEGDGENDAHNDHFTISGNQLQTAVEFDFESHDPQQHILIQAEDDQGHTLTQALVVNIQDVNEAPTDLQLSGKNLAEDAPVGSIIGGFSTADEDIDDSHTYSLVTGDGTNDADNNHFEIVGDSLRTATELDFESQQEHSVFVETRDAADNTLTKSFTIQVSDVEEATGIDDWRKSGWRLYPNPSAGKLILEGTLEKSHTATATVTNLEGRVLLIRKLEGDLLHEEIHLEELAKGIYILKIKQNKNIYHKKFILH